MEPEKPDAHRERHHAQICAYIYIHGVDGIWCDVPAYDSTDGRSSGMLQAREQPPAQGQEGKTRFNPT